MEHRQSKNYYVRKVPQNDGTQMIQNFHPIFVTVLNHAKRVTNSLVSVGTFSTSNFHFGYFNLYMSKKQQVQSRLEFQTSGLTYYY